MQRRGIIHLARDSDFIRKRKGFTLLEVMIALAIIGTALAVVLHSVNYHADIMYQNTVTTQMYQMAKEKMYELENTHAASKGRINPVYSYENSVTSIGDTELLRLRTTVTGQEKEVSLTEVVVKENNQAGGQGAGVEGQGLP